MELVNSISNNKIIKIIIFALIGSILLTISANVAFIETNKRINTDEINLNLDIL